MDVDGAAPKEQQPHSSHPVRENTYVYNLDQKDFDAEFKQFIEKYHSEAVLRKPYDFDTRRERDRAASCPSGTRELSPEEKEAVCTAIWDMLAEHNFDLKRISKLRIYNDTVDKFEFGRRINLIQCGDWIDIAMQQHKFHYASKEQAIKAMLERVKYV